MRLLLFGKLNVFFSCVDGSMRETIQMTLHWANWLAFGLSSQMWNSKLPFTDIFFMRLLCFLWLDLADVQLSYMALTVSAGVSQPLG